jgi:hypothetical protein
MELFLYLWIITPSIEQLFGHFGAGFRAKWADFPLHPLLPTTNSKWKAGFARSWSLPALCGNDLRQVEPGELEGLVSLLADSML